LLPSGHVSLFGCLSALLDQVIMVFRLPIGCLDDLLEFHFEPIRLQGYVYQVRDGPVERELEEEESEARKIRDSNNKQK